MSKDYSIYRFFKGENENPFDPAKDNSSFNFWDYENTFEERFNQGKFTAIEWVPPSAADEKEWNNILTKKPIDKQELFKLWIYHLLMVRLPEEYQSDPDYFLNLYFGS